MTAQIGEREGQVFLRSPEEMRGWGKGLAHTLHGGDILLLHGTLGTGKTVLAAGIATGLGATTWRGSPTFALLNEYDTSPRLIHLDLYRLTDEEVQDLGLEEYATDDAILVCEWPERAERYLRSLAMARVIDIEIEHAGEGERVVWMRESRETRPE